MGLRTSAANMFGAPTMAVIEASLRDLVEEALNSRAFVTRDEVLAVERSIEALRRDLAARRASLAAMQQAIEAFNLDDDFGFGDDEDEDEDAVDTQVSRLEETRDELRKSLDRTTGALDVLTKQVNGLQTTLGALDTRVGKAHLLATSARVTAETAADGISSLESKQATS